MLRRVDENTLSHTHKNEENEVSSIKNDSIRDEKLHAPHKSPARRPINTGLRDREKRQTPSKSRVFDAQRSGLTPLTPTKNTKKPFVFKDPLKTNSTLPTKRKKEEVTKKELKDDYTTDNIVTSRKKLDLGPIDETEIEYAPPKADDEPYQPEFSVDLTAFNKAPDLGSYEWVHTAEADTITKQPREDDEDLGDLIFKSLEQPAKTLEITSSSTQNSIITAKHEIILQSHDESDVEYAPPKEEERPYCPEFAVDIDLISKDVPSAIYEFGHLLDSEPSISLILDSGAEETLGPRYTQDEFEFDFGDNALNNQIEDEPIRVAFDDFLFDVGAVHA
ncbi:hypothetical protein INT43_004719 [Umbelopsis isabellina]|uniref:Uncharacterized protein n=1 Tax=Mortierella isabellina TaxID=91625 RepID=A0A8H7U8J0_MORIS|nr:hypothetical protein INT43_004719 [Umbelopsis isabellina]